MRAAGLETFQQDVGGLVPFEAERARILAHWDQIKLLTVQVNRMTTWWREGFLCIGDAAHAMSPVGGFGANVAVQDAVAASNILAEPLRNKVLRSQHLSAVQRRREWPTRVTQRLQLFVQNNVIAPALPASRLRRWCARRVPEGMLLCPGSCEAGHQQHLLLRGG